MAVTTIIDLCRICIMLVKQCQKPPMIGNGRHTSYLLWWWLGDGLWNCLTHLIKFIWALCVWFCTGLVTRLTLERPSMSLFISRCRSCVSWRSWRWDPEKCNTWGGYNAPLLSVLELTWPILDTLQKKNLADLSWFVDNPVDTSSTRTRRGGSCLKDIYKTFLIYRTCMRRAPAKPVRACTLRNWCPLSHVTFEAPLRPSHFSLHSSHSTLHTSHFTLHTSHFTLHSSQSTLHTSHSTLHTSHFSLLIAFFTLHTSHCNLQPEIQEPHGTTHTTTRCKTHRRNNSRMKRPQPQPPHRRGTFHRRLQPLYTEKHKVWCSGFLPKT